MTVSNNRIEQQDLRQECIALENAALQNPPVEGTAKPPKMRVLFLINSLEGGGAERVFSTLVNRIQPYLPTADVDVVLIDSKTQRYEIAAPLKVVCLGSDGSLWESIKRYKQYLDNNRPTVVISFLTRANYLSVAFARFYGYRCIISERSNPQGRLGNDFAGRIKKWLVRAMYPGAHHVIAVSEGIKASLVDDFGVSEQGISVIPNPCDIAELERQGQLSCELMQDVRLHEGFILAVGRLVGTKRFDVLIRAYASGGFTLPLVILGEGPKLQEWQSLAFDLGVSERVLFPGFLANPYAVMSRATVFVLSSELEGFPNCLIEAMGLGVPIIASNCCHGPAEILDERRVPTINGVHKGKHGLLVPTGDVNSFTEAIRQVLSNSELESDLRARARLRAADFSVPSTISRYASAINEQLKLVPSKKLA